MHYWNLAALPQCSEIFMHTCQNKEVFSLFPVGWEFCFIFYMNSVEYSYMFFCIWKKDNPIPSSSPSCPYENNIGWFSNVSLLVHFWNKITLVKIHFICILLDLLNQNFLKIFCIYVHGKGWFTTSLPGFGIEVTLVSLKKKCSLCFYS